MSEIRLQEPVEVALKEPSLSDDRKASLMAVQGYIMLIKKPGDDQLYGPVENSFSLGIEPNRTFLYWTSEHRQINGWDWVNKDLVYWKGQHPDYEYTIYDVRDAEKLPIVLNWDLWLDAHTPSDKTMAGIKNKHEARNLRFKLKGEAKDTRTTVPGLTMQITIHSLV
jgi:hypothetical protein